MNYKESQIVGTEYQRAKIVEIHNQKDVPPHIAFIEEMITILPGRVLSVPAGQIGTVYNPHAVIELYNPETGDAIMNADGTHMTVSQQMVMLAIHSLYMQLVRERDAANAPVVEVAPEIVLDPLPVPITDAPIVDDPVIDPIVDPDTYVMPDVVIDPVADVTQPDPGTP